LHPGPRSFLSHGSCALAQRSHAVTFNIIYFSIS
jgi:hypothetical protein